jgi:hypothetical protein
MPTKKWDILIKSYPHSPACVIPDEDLKLSLATLETRRQLHRAPRRPHHRHTAPPHRRARAPRALLRPVLPPTGRLLDRRRKRPSSPAACCVHTPASARNSSPPTSPSSAMELAAAVPRSRAACIPRRSLRPTLLCAHTRVWRLRSMRVVRPLHVRHALEFGGGG